MTSFVAFFYGLARLNAEIYLCKLHFVIAVRSSLLYVILKLGHPLLSFHSARAKVSQQSLFASTVHCSVNVAQLFTSFDSYLGLQRLLSGWTVDNVNNMESWKVSDNKCESFQQNRTSIKIMSSRRTPMSWEVRVSSTLWLRGWMNMKRKLSRTAGS